MTGPGQTMGGLRWERQRVSHRLNFGDLVVCRPRFDALVARDHFLAMRPGLETAPPVAEMQAAGVDVALLDSCPVARPLPRLCRARGVLRYVVAHYNHYVVRLDKPFAEYLASMTAKTRSTIRRKVKKFRSAFPDGECFKVYRRPEDMDEFICLARQIAKKTYQEHLLGQGLPDTDEFRQDLADRARRGEVLGFILFANGTPVAYTHGPIADGVILYSHVGYDPAFRAWSPGTVLQYLVIEHLFTSTDLRVYDLGDGDWQHKHTFANHRVFCADLCFFRPGPLSLGVVLAHLILDKTSRLIARTLERTHLKSKIKNLLRSRSVRSG